MSYYFALKFLLNDNNEESPVLSCRDGVLFISLSEELLQISFES